MKALIAKNSIFLLFFFSFFLIAVNVPAQKKGKGKTEEKPIIEEKKEITLLDIAHSDFDASNTFNSFEEASKDPVTVVKLDLSNQNLTSIPSDISKFSNLAVLNLSGNNIENTGTELKKLQHLRELHLANNKISVFPSDLSKIKSLKSLTLSGNTIVSLPAAIGDFENLEMLFLQNNQIEKLPSEIGKLKSLRYLYLYGNKLKQLPVEICNLAQLQVLFLQNNELARIPHDIVKLNKLVYFSVVNQKIDLEDPFQYLHESFYVQIPPEGITLNQFKVLYGIPNSINIPSAPANRSTGMTAQTQITSNIAGTSSSLFNTNYPPGFRPYSYARTVFQAYYFPITGIHWIISKNFRTKMRFTEIYRIEKRINKEERKRKPNINRIEMQSLRRAKLLSKIQ